MNSFGFLERFDFLENLICLRASILLSTFGFLDSFFPFNIS